MTLIENGIYYILKFSGVRTYKKFVIVEDGFAKISNDCSKPRKVYSSKNKVWIKYEGGNFELYSIFENQTNLKELKANVSLLIWGEKEAGHASNWYYSKNDEIKYRGEVYQKASEFNKNLKSLYGLNFYDGYQLILQEIEDSKITDEFLEKYEGLFSQMAVLESNRFDFFE